MVERGRSVDIWGRTGIDAMKISITRCSRICNVCCGVTGRTVNVHEQSKIDTKDSERRHNSKEQVENLFLK